MYERTMWTVLLAACLLACGESRTSDASEIAAEAPSVPEVPDVPEPSPEPEPTPAPVPLPVEALTLEGIRNVHRVGNLTLAGQPSEDGLDLLSEQGVELIISLRQADEEVGYDEPAAVELREMEFVNPGFRAAEELTDERLDALRALLTENEGRQVFLHCGSAHRVGAAWMAYRVLDQGVAVETALEEAHEVGLRAGDHEARALDYIRSRL